MSSLQQEEKSILHPVSFFDLVCLFKRSKKKIVFCSLFFSVIGLLYAMTRPIEYESSATFREQTKTQSGIGNMSLASMLNLGSSVNGPSEAISLLKSRRLLEQLVRQLGMQAKIKKSGITLDFLNRMKDNVLVDYAILVNPEEPLLIQCSRCLYVRDVIFNEEKRRKLTIKFISENDFQVFDKENLIVEKASIGRPVDARYAIFTLNRENDQTLMDNEFSILFKPLYEVIQKTAKKFNIEPDREDKQLIKLKFSNESRSQAIEGLNRLMMLYQSYLRNDQKHTLTEQIDYLHSRQDHMQDKLQEMMEVHATRLASDAASTGFLNSSKAMEFLAGNLQHYTQQLIANDLEMKQLARVQEEGTSSYDRLATKNENAPINQILSKTRSLRQQADSLDLVLREFNADPKASEASFIQHSEDLEKVRRFSKEANEMLASLEMGVLPSSDASLYAQPKYMVKAWCEKLRNSKNIEESQACSANFTAYLNNLLHLFHVHAKAIQERLAHQQSSLHEFQGMDLPTAQSLYIDYTRQMNEIEGALLQYRFIIEKMQEKDFEMTALSTVLTDTVSRDMISHAAEAAMALKDQNNRSTKEQDRLKQELSLQKGFLTAHIEQTIQLKQIQKQLIEDKIKILQSATLGLIQQEISVLEEHLAEYIKTRIDNLIQERHVLIEHQQELQKEMARWPNQWVSEMLIEQQMEINKRMVEEITKLVESKNITSNLEVIRSAPIDYPVTPPLPKRPNLLLFAILGAIFGCIVPFTAAVLKALVNGIPLTAENLTRSGCHVSGNISRNYGCDSSKPLHDSDLNTLRRLTTFLDSVARTEFVPRIPLSERLLLLTGKGPDYSSDLAMLLNKKGLRVLLIPFSFNANCPPEELPGLLQYLEGQAPKPLIIKGKQTDRISPGGITRFATELLSTEAFYSLLEGLQQNYDWVIGVSDMPIGSPEAESIVKAFSCAACTVTDETWNDLSRCMQSKKQFSFIINENI